jgi:hypothetical protein
MPASALTDVASCHADASGPVRDAADHGWLLEALTHGGAQWVANINARVTRARIGEHDVPVTILTGAPAHSAYVGSPRAAWISYPYAEALDLFTGWRQACAAVALGALAAPIVAAMTAGGIDRAAVVSNHLVSTNLHPAWPPDEIAAATLRLAAMFPHRPLLMRNICPAVDPRLAAGLLQAGWRLVPARRIYVADPRESALWKHNHLKRDVRLLARSDLELLRPEAITAADLPGLQAVFRQLFIAKHSTLNPDYTDAFFAFCRERRFLDLYALRQCGRPVGVLGVYERGGWATTPLIGYDTTLPQEMGIYRRLMALLFREAHQRGCRLHLSSGAGGFKSARGGVAHVEYTAVHARHLMPPRRVAIAAFAALMERAVPWALAQAERPR